MSKTETPKIPEFIYKFVERNKAFYDVFNKIISSGIYEIFLKLEDDNEILSRFFKDISEIDFNLLKQHREIFFNGNIRETKNLEHLIPPEVERLSETDIQEGILSLKHGKWACLTLAGGSATRFFSELPEEQRTNVKSTKGLFPITLIGKFSFLEVFAGEILARAFESGKIPVWCILTSSTTHKEIEDFISSKPFGIPQDFIFLIRQRELPRIDEKGLPVLRKDGSIVKTGDGHGGALFAILSIKEFLLSAGIEFIVLHNVDNLLAQPLFPTRLGFHIRKGNLFTSSVVKRKEGEKIGIPVYDKARKKKIILEYNEAGEILSLKNGNKLAFEYGHINTNLFSLNFITPDILKNLRPVVYTQKKVKVDDNFIITSSIEFLNHYIAEILDENRVSFVEVERESFFSPTKSVFGEDSVETTQKNYINFTRKKLEKVGAIISEKAKLELAPSIIFSEKILNFFDFSGWKLEDDSLLFISCFYPEDGEKSFLQGLNIKKGGELKIISKYPFGEIGVDNRRNFKIENPPTIKFGRDVVIESGISVFIELEKGAKLFVRDGTKITKNIHIKIPSGSKFEI
jgi:UDP-N-acetylglucosamine pyrophosphorylase